MYHNTYTRQYILEKLPDKMRKILAGIRHSYQRLPLSLKPSVAKQRVGLNLDVVCMQSYHLHKIYSITMNERVQNFELNGVTITGITVENCVTPVEGLSF